MKLSISTFQTFKHHLYSLVAIMLCLAAGYIVNTVITFIPPSLFGMIILAMGLKLEWISAHAIEQSVNWVIKHMGVCFVPAGVGIMEHFELIKHDGPVMLLLTVLSTLLLMFIVAWLYQKHTAKGSSNG